MKKLYRSTTNMRIAGVFGGLGNYFSVDPTVLRLFGILALIFSAILPVLIAYIICWIVIPLEQ